MKQIYEKLKVTRRMLPSMLLLIFLMAGVSALAQVPSSTTPVYPADGQNNVCPTGFILQWAPVPGATGYKVYLSGDPNQNPLPYWFSTSNTSSIPFYTGYGITTRWKIVPYNASGDAINCPT